MFTAKQLAELNFSLKIKLIISECFGSVLDIYIFELLKEYKSVALLKLWPSENDNPCCFGKM